MPIGGILLTPSCTLFCLYIDDSTQSNDSPSSSFQNKSKATAVDPDDPAKRSLEGALRKLAVLVPYTASLQLAVDENERQVLMQLYELIEELIKEVYESLQWNFDEWSNGDNPGLYQLGKKVGSSATSRKIRVKKWQKEKASRERIRLGPGMEELLKLIGTSFIEKIKGLNLLSLYYNPERVKELDNVILPQCGEIIHACVFETHNPGGVGEMLFWMPTPEIRAAVNMTLMNATFVANEQKIDRIMGRVTGAFNIDTWITYTTKLEDLATEENDSVLSILPVQHQEKHVSNHLCNFMVGSGRLVGTVNAVETSSHFDYVEEKIREVDSVIIDESLTSEERRHSVSELVFDMQRHKVSDMDEPVNNWVHGSKYSPYYPPSDDVHAGCWQERYTEIVATRPTTNLLLAKHESVDIVSSHPLTFKWFKSQFPEDRIYLASRSDAPYFLEGKSGHALLVTRSHFPIHAVPDAVDRDQRIVTTSDLLFLKSFFCKYEWVPQEEMDLSRRIYQTFLMNIIGRPGDLDNADNSIRFAVHRCLPVGMYQGGVPHLFPSVQSVLLMDYHVILHFLYGLGDDKFHQFFGCLANPHYNVESGTPISNAYCGGYPEIFSKAASPCGRLFTPPNPPECIGAHTPGHGLSKLIVCRVCAQKKKVKESYEFEALKGIKKPTAENEARLEVVSANQQRIANQVNNGNTSLLRHNPTVDYSAMLDRRLQEVVASGEPFFVMCGGNAVPDNPTTADGSPFVLPTDGTVIRFEERKKRRKKNKKTKKWEYYSDNTTHETVFRVKDFIWITFGGLQSRCRPEHSGTKKQNRNKVLHFPGHTAVHDNKVS